MSRSESVVAPNAGVWERAGDAAKRVGISTRMLETYRARGVLRHKRILRGPFRGSYYRRADVSALARARVQATERAAS